MNKKKKVISRGNIPPSSPVLSTVVAILAMDYWDAAEWVWGGVGLLLLMLWIAFIISFWNNDHVDIFEDKA